MTDFFTEIGGTLQVSYPFRAGFKKHGTSSEAAPTATETATLRDQVLAALRVRDMTSDECAEVLGKSPFSIRPRLTELQRLGRVAETDQRRRNASGKMAAVLHAR